MLTRIFLTSLLLATTALIGCVDHAPAYQEQYLTFDEGLLGTWTLHASPLEQNEPATTLPVTVARRDAHITSGRLGDFNDAANKDGKKLAPAYTFTVTLPQDSDKPPRPPRTYEGVLLSIDGATFLAYELASTEPPVADYFGDVLPVHRILRVERSGDTLDIAAMKAQLVWMPTVRSAYDASKCPTLPEIDGLWFVENPDHLTTLLQQAAARKDLWQSTLHLTRSEP